MSRPWMLPFTTVLVLAIIVASFLAHDLHGQLDRDVASQVGHAPRHWWAGELVRLITSIPFTSDRWHLAAALTMTALCVGFCERMYGTFATLGMFLASHCATLAVLAGCLIIGHAFMTTHATGQLLDISDVGPSAGYYGCLGAVLMQTKRKPVLILSCLLALFLSIRVIISSLATTFQPHVFQTDLAHWIAFLLGCLLRRSLWSAEAQLPLSSQ